MGQHQDMTDRPASWRMPTPKQMEKLAAAAAARGNVAPVQTPGPGDEMPPEYWQAVLDDASADARPIGSPIQKRRLCDIERHVLRVSCTPSSSKPNTRPLNDLRRAGRPGAPAHYRRRRRGLRDHPRPGRSHRSFSDSAATEWQTMEPLAGSLGPKQ